MGRITFKKWFEHYKPDEETTTILANGYTKIVETDEICPSNSNYYLVGTAIDKLADYEDAEEQGLLLRLPKEIQDIDKRMLEYAFVKAINLVKYGVDVDSKLESAVETSYALHNAYMKGTKDAVDRVYESKTEIRNKAIDEFVEKLSTNVESFEGVVNGIRASLMTEDYFHEYIWEIAEQMKGEGV